MARDFEYIEEQVDPALRAAMEEHFRDCNHCTAVLDGTRNADPLCYGDERLLEVPVGFSGRLPAPQIGNGRCPPQEATLGADGKLCCSGVDTIGGVAGVRPHLILPCVLSMRNRRWFRCPQT